MSTVNEDLVEGKLLYLPQHGVVVDVADPLKRHRVKATIDGIVEETQWAYPTGGGGKARGAHICPPVGAHVVIIFLGGDVERPVYLPGWWVDDELPEDLDGLSEGDAPLVQVVETSRFKVTIDEREGKEQLVLADKLTGDVIQMDGVNGGVQVKATTVLLLKADGHVAIEGTEVTINGRPVLSDGRAI